MQSRKGCLIRGSLFHFPRQDAFAKADFSVTIYTQHYKQLYPSKNSLKISAFAVNPMYNVFEGYYFLKSEKPETYEY
jgi:hypothetical protein